MLNYLMLGDFFSKGAKSITFALDTLVYKLAQLSFSIFSYLSSITLAKPEIIDTYIRRLYVIIGLVMIFVIAYNLLNYIINPDKVSDKNMGASAFIKDIIIALVIITVLPTAFRKAYSFQNVIIEKGIISNILLGGDAQNVENDNGLSDIKLGANTTVANVFTAFFTPKYSKTNDPDGPGFSTLDCGENGLNADMEQYCAAYYETLKTGDIDSFKSLIDKDNEEKYRYWFLLSTVAGIVLSFFMLSYCINLGIRAGNLALLTIIAPIPALLEIVPGKKGTRKKWAETTLKTYLDVFVYQATIFLIISLISLIPDVIGELFNSGKVILETSDIAIMGFSTVFLIFGLLQFGKEAPKLISEVLGIKDNGEFAKVAKRALTMGGVTAGLAGSTIGRFSREYNAAGGGTKGIANGLTGSISGIGRTLWGARNVHNLKDAKALRTKVNKDIVTSRVNRNAYAFAHQGESITGAHYKDLKLAAGGAFRKFTGAYNEYDKMKDLEQVHTDYKKLFKDNIESIWKNDSKWQAYNTELMRAEAIGDTTAAENAKKKRDSRQEAVLVEKKLDFMEGAGKINNFIDAHQGYDGISGSHIDIEAINSITEATVKATLGDVESIVKNDGNGGGFEPVLDAIKNNTDYQTARVKEKLAEDAKKTRQEAANKETEKDKK